MNEFYLTPLLHPAAIVRGLWGREPAQTVYLRRVVECLKSGEPPAQWDTNQPPPNWNLFPSLERLERFHQEFTAGNWDSMSIDIESAGPHIICVGLAQLSLAREEVGAGLCVRFRRRGGGLWWNTQNEHTTATRLLAELLANPAIAKVFHNGVTFDIPVLEEIGFEVEGRLVDTMVLAHTAYSEFPKSLQFCATLYTWAPVWKSLVEEKDDVEGKS